SFARMVPVRPTPTVTTSTGFSLVAMALGPRLVVEHHVDRVAVLVHMGDFLGDVGDRHRLGAVGDAVLLDEGSVYSGEPGEAHQLPAGLVAVPAVYRVGEKTLDGVGEQHVEEKLRAHLLELDLASVKALQHLVLLHAGGRVEGLAVGFAAIVVRIADSGAVDRRGRQRRLVALLRRPLGPRALRVLLRHRSVTAEELLVDEGGDPSLLRARS